MPGHRRITFGKDKDDRLGEWSGSSLLLLIPIIRTLGEAGWILGSIKEEALSFGCKAVVHGYASQLCDYGCPIQCGDSREALGVCIGAVERRGKGSMEVNGGKGPSPLWQWPIRSNVHSYHYPQFAGTTRRI